MVSRTLHFRGSAASEQRLIVLAGSLLLVLVVPACGRKTIDLAVSRAEEGADGGAVDGGTRGSGGQADGGARRSDRLSCDPDGPDVCTARGEVCVPETGLCGACTSETEEKQCRLYERRCDTTANECVQCLSDADCLLTGVHCNVVLHQCTTDCQLDGCRSAGLFFRKSVCDAESSLCVECQEDADCVMQSSPRNIALRCEHGACTECTTDADCEEGHCEHYRRRCVR